MYTQNIYEMKELRKGNGKDLVGLGAIERTVVQWAVKRN